MPPSAPLSPNLRAHAPTFALRLGAILRALATLIAARFIRTPRLIPLILPLWRSFTRKARHVERLMACLAAGRLPRPSAPRPHRTSPPSLLPQTRGLLLTTLKHEAGVYRAQLEVLLAHPETAALLAAAPAMAALLRPICRLLALDHPALTPVPKNAKPTPQPTKAAPIFPPIPPSTPPCPRRRPWFPRQAFKPA